MVTLIYIGSASVVGRVACLYILLFGVCLLRGTLLRCVVVCVRGVVRVELVRCIYIGSASVAVLWHVVAVLRAYTCRLLACYLIARSGHRLATVGTVVAPLAPDRQRGGSVF